MACVPLWCRLVQDTQQYRSATKSVPLSVHCQDKTESAGVHICACLSVIPLATSGGYGNISFKLWIELVADTFNHPQNFGIIIAFGIGFLFCLLTFTEINTGHAGEGSATLFKAGSKAPVIKEAEAAVGDDEEKGHANSSPVSVDGQEGAVKEDSKAKQAIREQPKMMNTFSWQHINYFITVSGEKRQLLDDVSGYVAPGKLTALMGESGAGKVMYLGSTI